MNSCFPWQLTAPACQLDVVKEAGFSSTMRQSGDSGATLKPVVQGETLLCSHDWRSAGRRDGGTGWGYTLQVTGRTLEGSLEGSDGHFERMPRALVGGERQCRRLANQKEDSFWSLHQGGGMERG